MDTNERSERSRFLRSIVGYLLGAFGAILMVGGIVAISVSGAFAYRAAKGYEANWTGLELGLFAALFGFAMVRLGRYVLPKDKR